MLLGCPRRSTQQLKSERSFSPLQNVSRYQALSLGAEVTESQLKGQLAEYLNAEIVLLTIPNVTRAMDWLRQSFLYVRVGLRNL